MTSRPLADKATRVIRTMEVSGFRLTEVVYGREDETSVPRANPTLSLTLDGVPVEGYTNAASPPEAPRAIFEPRDGNSAKLVTSHAFTLEVLPERQQQLGGLSDLSSRVAFHGGPVPATLRKLYEEFCSADSLAPLAMESLAIEALLQTVRGAGERHRKTPAWLDRVRTLIQEEHTEQLSLGEIGREVGVHPAHLARAFRERYGCTVGEYIRHLRVESARKLLAETDTPVSQIASDCGFSDQSHLTRVFSRLIGTTPAAYRRSYKLRMISERP